MKRALTYVLLITFFSLFGSVSASGVSMSGKDATLIQVTANSIAKLPAIADERARLERAVSIIETVVKLGEDRQAVCATLAAIGFAESTFGRNNPDSDKNEVLFSRQMKIPSGIPFVQFFERLIVKLKFEPKGSSDLLKSIDVKIVSAKV